MLTVRISPEQRSQIETILDRSAGNVWECGMEYRKSGWKSFDPAAPANDADPVRKERDLYRKNAA